MNNIVNHNDESDTILSQTNLPREVKETLSVFLDLLDSKLPNLIVGLYLTGSIVLNDYRPGLSDIDFVAVIENQLKENELKKLTEIHLSLGKRNNAPKLDGIYVTWNNLKTSAEGLKVPSYRNGKFYSTPGFVANPITWHTLNKYTMSIRGPASINVYDDDKIMRDWCRSNLKGYWTNWIKSARTNPKDIVFTLTSAGVAWGVLGVIRLYATIYTGEIISKSEAGEYALRTFDSKWERIIRNAINIRRGESDGNYYNIFKRRKEMLAFMEIVLVKGLEM